MAREAPVLSGTIEHAKHRNAALSMASGALILVVGIALLLTCLFARETSLPMLFLGLIMSVRGAMYLAAATLQLFDSSAVQPINKAESLMYARRFAEAEEHLDYAETRAVRTTHFLAIALNRANIALRRGRVKEALRHTTRVIERPPGWGSRAENQLSITSALSLRALLSAPTAAPADVLADIEAVHQSDMVTEEARGRAELARAVLIERTGDHEALKRHLREKRSLLLQIPHLDERALVRAYQRMTQVKSASIYRQIPEMSFAAAPEGDGWIRQLSPSAAAFLTPGAHPTGASNADIDAPLSFEPSPSSVDQPAREGTEPFTRAPIEARITRPSPRLLRSLLTGSAVVAAVPLGIHLLSPATLPALGTWVQSVVLSTHTFFKHILPTLLLLMISWVAWWFLGMYLQKKRIADAVLLFDRGEEERGLAALTSLMHQVSDPILAASTHFTLAIVADRRADFDTALRHCNEALHRLDSPRLRALSSDQLLPSLVAKRALLFAATGRHADARAEFAFLAANHPTYSSLDASRFQLALVLAASRGDLERLAALSQQTGGRVLPVFDDLLASLGHAAARPHAMGPGERARLEAELNDDPVIHEWLQKVAPALLTAFIQAGEQSAEENSGAFRTARCPVTHADAAAITEAEAEVEAEAAARTAANARSPDVMDT
ncbi:hypothetical protein [Chondromyces crocatus]|uniref:Uncharacterized protein n=1 Tax=Chondromyces crocatus TaxID=52 RepID=A0A0K1EAS9_CHOCO|nr:hypothetical protein [Chondromyces crocatus]AKT37991.1 uncharacterized protein CMC5_021320 [Chondromyces crocatus]